MVTDRPINNKLEFTQAELETLTAIFHPTPESVVYPSARAMLLVIKKVSEYGKNVVGPTVWADVMETPQLGANVMVSLLAGAAMGEACPLQFETIFNAKCAIWKARIAVDNLSVAQLCMENSTLEETQNYVLHFLGDSEHSRKGLRQLNTDQLTYVVKRIFTESRKRFRERGKVENDRHVDTALGLLQKFEPLHLFDFVEMADPIKALQKTAKKVKQH